MNKTELVALVAQKAQMSKESAAEAVDATFDGIFMAPSPKKRASCGSRTQSTPLYTPLLGGVDTVRARNSP